MKKRGAVGQDFIVKFIIGLLLGATLTTTFLTAGTNWGRGEVAQKLAIANDIGIIISMLQSSTSDTYIDYRKDISKYSIRIDEKCVEVFSTVKDSTKAQHCFLPSNTVKPNVFRNPKNFFIIKDRGGIHFSENPKPKISSNWCEQPELLLKDSSILINPIFDESISKETGNLLKITNYLYNQLNSRIKTDTTLANLRSLSDTEKISSNNLNIKKAEADLIIYIEISEDPLNSISIITSSELDTGHNLNSISCNIVNSIQNTEELDIYSLLNYASDDHEFLDSKTILIKISDKLIQEDTDFKTTQIGIELGKGFLNVIQ